MQTGRNRVGVWVAMGVLLLSTAAAWGAGSYLGPGDWQYQELDRLSRAGLLVGHPKAPLATWTDRLSRYEAAALTLRAVEGMGQVYQAQGEKLRQLAQANEPVPAAEAPVAVAEAPAAPSATGVELRAEDLLAVQKLLQEFRTELVGMGERLDELDQSLKLMLGVVDEIQKNLASVSTEVKRHKLGGYMQLRWDRDSATKGPNDFFFKTARVDMRGPLGPNTSYRIEAQLDGKESVTGVNFSKETTSSGGPGSKAQLRTCSLDYRFNDLSFLRAGQVTLPFGYELEEATPDLWTGDRSVMMDTLFPNQRDVGAFTEFRALASLPLVDLGLFNGTGINTFDNNELLNILARVKAAFPNGSGALSIYNGGNGPSNTRTSQNRYGIGTKFALGQLLFMGEGIVGTNLGEDVAGWYGQAGYPVLKNRPNLAFAKCDTYDQDVNAPNNSFRRWSLGYWYELDPWTRLTVVWELRNVDRGFANFTTWNGNAAFLQFQMRY